MTDKEARELLAKVAAENPLAAQMMRVAQGGMVSLMEVLTEDGASVEINGVKVTPNDAKRARATFGPNVQSGKDRS